jgi:hypothetical protein
MAKASERMRAMRERRRAQGMRELRLIVPDAMPSEAWRRRCSRCGWRLWEASAGGNSPDQGARMRSMLQ